MTKKATEKRETRTATVGVLMSPTEKRLLKEKAQAEARTVSSLTYLLLLESPTFKRLMRQTA